MRLMGYSLAPTEELDRLLNINVKGTFFSYKYAAIQLIKQGTGGRMIGAASVASKRGASSTVCRRDAGALTQRGRVPAARGVRRVQVRGARHDAVRSDGLWQVRDHRERVCPRGHRDEAPYVSPLRPQCCQLILESDPCRGGLQWTTSTSGTRSRRASRGTPGARR